MSANLPEEGGHARVICFLSVPSEYNTPQKDDSIAFKFKFKFKPLFQLQVGSHLMSIVCEASVFLVSSFESETPPPQNGEGRPYFRDLVTHLPVVSHIVLPSCPLMSFVFPLFPFFCVLGH